MTPVVFSGQRYTGIVRDDRVRTGTLSTSMPVDRVGTCRTGKRFCPTQAPRTDAVSAKANSGMNGLLPEKTTPASAGVFFARISAKGLIRRYPPARHQIPTPNSGQSSVLHHRHRRPTRAEYTGSTWRRLSSAAMPRSNRELHHLPER